MIRSSNTGANTPDQADAEAFQIIDCHCHYGKGDGLIGPWDTAAPLGLYMRRAARAGIQKTVLFAAFHSDYHLANRAVARMVQRHPARFYGFAFVNPVSDRGRVYDMLQEAVEQHGFVGVKVHRHDARITREICEAALAFSLPVLYDVMGEVSTVELLAEEYPRLNFIIPHLGSFADDWKAQRAFIYSLARHPNIYTDTSGVRRFDLLQEAVRTAGAGKILFGSDGPWLHPAVELSKVHALRLPPAEERQVLSGNLLGLIASGPNARGRLARSGPQQTRLQTAVEGELPPSQNMTLSAPEDPWVTGLLYE